MSDRKFKDGDRVVVSQTPVEASDKRYAGEIGTVTKLAHRNGTRDVYHVALDVMEHSIAFYDVDLLPYGELGALREELAQAEAKVVSLKEAIKAKERNAKELPIATVVTYTDTFGLASITKQAEDIWLNVFPTQSGNSNTELLNDYKVTRLLTGPNTVVRKP